MTIAEQLLDDYNHYRNQTAHVKQLRDSGQYVQGLGRKRLNAFEDLASWCQEQNVEPRRWLASLFETRRWLFAPPLKQLKSKKHLQRFPNVNVPAFTNLLHQQRSVRQHQAGKTFDPNRDIAPAAEAIKRRLLALGQWDRCMSKMGTETFGFHPKSQVCVKCPASGACAQRLRASVGYDIQALRRGEITVEQAKAVVYYARQGS